MDKEYQEIKDLLSEYEEMFDKDPNAALKK